MKIEIHRFHSPIACGLFLFAVFASTLASATIELRPVADTTLIETAPDANLGGHRFVNAGATGLTPATRNHALLRFDLTNQLPVNATIVSVELVLEVVGQPRDGGVEGIFELHRVLQSWGEGKQVGEFASPGLGEAAVTNEATWTHRFAFTNEKWGAPGASATNDFAAQVSAEQMIYGVADSPYTFGPTANLLADVQFWLGQPEKNFGWLLKGADETVRFTARRFGAREDPVNAPILRIQYEVGPALAARRTTNRIELSFAVEASKDYAIEFRPEAGSGAWMTLTNIGSFSETKIVAVSDVFSVSRRFYRVRVGAGAVAP